MADSADGNSVQDHLRKGEAALQAGRFDESAQEYREARRLDPSSVAAMYGLGMALSRLGIFDDAVASFRGAAKGDPKHPFARYGLAYCLQAKGDLQEALSEYERYIAAAPPAAAAYVEDARKRVEQLLPAVLGGGQADEAGEHPFDAAEAPPAETPLPEEPAEPEAGTAPPEAGPAAGMPPELEREEPPAKKEPPKPLTPFESLLEQARQERDAGRLLEAAESIRKARQQIGFERAPAALELLHELGAKGIRKGVKAGWQRFFIKAAADARAVAVSWETAIILSGHGDKTAKCVELENGKVMGLLEGHAAGVTAVGISLDGNKAFTGDADGAIKVWTLPEGKCLRTLTGHQKSVTALCALASGILSAGEDGTLRFWEAEEDRREAWFARQKWRADAHEGGVKALVVSRDGQEAFSSGEDGGLKSWRTPDGVMGEALEGPAAITSLEVMPAPGSLLIGTADGNVARWDLKTGAGFGLAAHVGAVRAVRLAFGGAYCLSAGKDKMLKLWDMARKNCVWAGNAHDMPITGACFSPDGRFAVSAGEDGLRIWELEWNFEFRPSEPKPAGPDFAASGAASGAGTPPPGGTPPGTGTPSPAGPEKPAKDGGLLGAMKSWFFKGS